MSTPVTETRLGATQALVLSGVRVDATATGVPIVNSTDLSVAAGQILGLVGESGSGKTTLGLACLGHFRRGTELAAGSITVQGEEITGLGAGTMRQYRGTRVTQVPQSPGTALNPALRLSTQLLECRYSGDERALLERIQDVLEEVALPSDADFLKRYPHQISGGQQQRLTIAMAFLARPGLVVLDEPATGLDVSTQKQVLETVRRLCTHYGSAAVYISHDMAAIATIADAVAVMYSGRVVEYGPTRDILDAPRHPYTERLLLAVPDLESRTRLVGIPGSAPSLLERPAGCGFAPRCALADEGCRATVPPAVAVAPQRYVRCFHEEMVGVSASAATEHENRPATRRNDDRALLSVEGLAANYGKRQILWDIDLVVARGRCVALVGESGSGKTTLSRCIAGLHAPQSGDILLDGERLAARSAGRTAEQRRRVQYIFQSPYASLNPRKTVRELVLAHARVLLPRVSDPDRTVAEALDKVALRPELARRYPDQLSGGERQRVAIARALVVGPEILICDEVTSALDVSIQATIVELLRGLQEERGLTVLFVTHNISLARNIADDLVVLKGGRIVEQGALETILDDPQDEHTRALIADNPMLRVT